MILDFTLSANRNRIRISAPQVDLTLDVRNLVGYHVATKQIVSIGDTPEEIKANAPAFWEKNHAKIEFLHPFGFAEVQAETGHDEPLIAARIVQWYSNKAFGRMDRRGFMRMLASPWVDRVDYNLELDGFETLPAQTRRQFVRHLKKLLVAVKGVRINGEAVLGKPSQGTKRSGGE